MIHHHHYGTFQKTQNELPTDVDALINDKSQTWKKNETARPMSFIAFALAIIFVSLVCCAGVVGYFAVLGRAILQEVHVIGSGEFVDRIIENSSQLSVAKSCGRKLLKSSTGLELRRPQTKKENNLHVLVVYGPSKDPWQEEMAEEVKKGVKAQPWVIDVEVRLMSVDNATFADVLWSDAVVVGSAVYNANVHPDVRGWMNGWGCCGCGRDLSLKVGAAFVTGGGISAGEEHVMFDILRTMMEFKMACVGGDSWRAAFGASAITDEDPFRQLPPRYSHSLPNPMKFPELCYQKDRSVHVMFLEKARSLGARVAQVTQLLHSSCKER